MWNFDVCLPNSNLITATSSALAEESTTKFQDLDPTIVREILQWLPDSNKDNLNKALSMRLLSQPKYKRRFNGTGVSSVKVLRKVHKKNAKTCSQTDSQDFRKMLTHIVEGTLAYFKWKLEVMSLPKSQTTHAATIACERQIAVIDRYFKWEFESIAKLHGLSSVQFSRAIGAKKNTLFKQKVKLAQTTLYREAQKRGLTPLKPISEWNLETYKELSNKIKCQDLLTLTSSLFPDKYENHQEELEAYTDSTALENQLIDWIEKNEQEINTIRSRATLFIFPQRILERLLPTLTELNLDVLLFAGVHAPILQKLVIRNANIYSLKGSKTPLLKSLGLYDSSIHSFKGFSFKSIQRCGIAGSRVQSFKGFNAPYLDLLHLCENRFDSYEGINAPRLTCLNLRGSGDNLPATFNGLFAPRIELLIFSSCTISSFEGLETRCIRSIYGSHSQIHSLKGLVTPELDELHLDGADIRSYFSLRCPVLRSKLWEQSNKLIRTRGVTVPASILLFLGTAAALYKMEEK